MQNIPAASAGTHLGFAWGPGDILVYETLYKASGMCRYLFKHFFCLFILLPNVTLLSPSVLYFQVPEDQGAPVSMRSGKMRTYTRPFYANSSMSHITSLSACRPLERTSPARTKNPSKAHRWTNRLFLCICHVINLYCKSRRSTN